MLAKTPSNIDALYQGTVAACGARAKDALAAGRGGREGESWVAEAHFLLGSVKVALNRTEEAKAEFTEVLKLNPRAGAAQTALAGLNLATGSTDAGVQFARTHSRRSRRTSMRGCSSSAG